MARKYQRRLKMFVLRCCPLLTSDHGDHFIFLLLYIYIDPWSAVSWIVYLCGLALDEQASEAQCIPPLRLSATTLLAGCNANVFSTLNRNVLLCTQRLFYFICFSRNANLECGMATNVWLHIVDGYASDPGFPSSQSSMDGQKETHYCDGVSSLS
ncbi:hypothetical protein CEXT_563191 [Caerostris extrusa]|uniref:Uncharacterized protein n=1 Tax=Caerostris extrusa TaxID=172846 RepID=A0AAV4N0M1_CAEEX|nr:hypothetical protein CEXT_563191 [Caerostris extrusa]